MTVGRMNVTPMKFSFKGNNVRSKVIDNKPYFVAKDVALAIGYKDTTSAIKKHIKNKYKVGGCRIATPSGIQEMTMISEPGIYQLAGQSRLPQAEPFQDWIFEEVLPSINKTGSYQAETKPMSATERLRLATQSIGEIDDRVSNLENTMEITTDDQYRLRETGKNKVLNVLGGKNSNAYRKLSRKVFAQMWRDFKHNFYLPRYAALPKKQLNAGLNFVKTWQPDEVTSYAIQGLNNQTDLDI